MASKAIKGITIKLDGESGELTKSINDADRSLKSLESQLKAVDKALELNPGNFDLIKQKQELLSREIETTKEKLEAEQAAAEQAAQALAEGTITQAEYDALQAEIQNTTNKLQELEKEAKSCGSAIGSSMQEASDKLESLGGKMTDAGKQMTELSAGIIAVGAASVSAFKEYDSALDTIIKKTGATGESLQVYEDILERIATEIPVDLDTAGRAIGDVATKFGVTGDQLEELSREFIMFARVNNTDVSSSVLNVQKAMRAFGLPAQDAEKVLDRLTSVSQRTGASVDTLALGLVQNSAAFMELGLNADQAIEFMGKLEMSGANAETVMQAMRKALKSAAEDGLDLEQALVQLQNKIRYGTDEMDGLTYSYEMFGKSGDQIYAAIKAGTIDFNRMGKAADSAGGTLRKTFEATLSPTDDMTMATNKAKIAASELGEQVASALVPIMEGLADIISDVSDWWQTLDSDTQQVIVTVGLIVAAIGPLLIGLGSLISNIGIVVGAWGTLSTFMSVTAVPAIAAAGPVILAVVAAFAAVEAIILAVQSVIENADGWMWGFEQLWNNIIEVCSEVVGGFEALGSAITDSLGDALDTVTSFCTKVGDFFEDIVSSAYTWGKDLISEFIEGLKSMWDSFVSTVKKYADKVKDYLGFSEPDEGPLSNFHTFAPDMIDLWNEGIYKNLDKVQTSAEVMAQTTMDPITDYSGQLEGISGQLAGIGSSNGTPVINFTANIGGRRFQQEVVAASYENDYFSGGF